MQKIGNILEDNKKPVFKTFKNLVTGYKIKEEYDDINYLLTILHIKKLLNFKSKERNM
jgi:hypothetical protein